MIRQFPLTQNARNLVPQLWPHSLALILLVEPFQAFMAKALNHGQPCVLLLLL
jgi:hypothetical protein